MNSAFAPIMEPCLLVFPQFTTPQGGFATIRSSGLRFSLQASGAGGLGTLGTLVSLGSWSAVSVWAGAVSGGSGMKASARIGAVLYFRMREFTNLSFIAGISWWIFMHQQQVWTA